MPVPPGLPWHDIDQGSHGKDKNCVQVSGQVSECFNVVGMGDGRIFKVTELIEWVCCWGILIEKI